MAVIYVPSATNTAQPADSDYAYLAAAELRTLKTYLAAQLAGLGGPVNASVFRNRNVLINGSMAVWQRGTAFTDQALTYGADRWLGQRAGVVAGQNTSMVVRPAATMPTTYAMKWQRLAGNVSVAAMNQYYALESVDSIPLAGQTLTLSFYALAGANFSAAGGTLTANLSWGTGIDQKVTAFTGATVAGTLAATLTTTVTRFSVTAAIPANATQIGITLTWTPVGTAGADDSVTFSAVQLELGGYATPFEVIPYADELARCKRYYQALSAMILSGCVTVAGLAYHGVWVLPVELRVATALVTFSGLIYSNGASITKPGDNAENLRVYFIITAAGYGHVVFSATLDAEI